MPLTVWLKPGSVLPSLSSLSSTSASQPLAAGSNWLTQLQTHIFEGTSVAINFQALLLPGDQPAGGGRGFLHHGCHRGEALRGVQERERQRLCDWHWWQMPPTLYEVVCSEIERGRRDKGQIEAWSCEQTFINSWEIRTDVEKEKWSKRKINIQQPRKYSNLQILGPPENLFGPERYRLMKKSSTTFQYLQPLSLKRLHKSQLYCIRKVWSALRRINPTICWTFCSNVVLRCTRR